MSKAVEREEPMVLLGALTAGQHRLTFNLPAKRHFFREDDHAVRISLGRKAIAFCPVAQSADYDDAVTVADRANGGREGGKEVQIDGRLSVNLLKTFTAMGASASRPFFLLRAVKGEDSRNWFEIAQHFDRDDSPPKSEPHLRVWFPRENTNVPRVIAVQDDIRRTLGPFADMVRSAKAVLEDARDQRRIGRPNKEVDDARHVMNMFQAFAREIAPIDWRSISASLNHALQSINAFDRGIGAGDANEAGCPPKGRRAVPAVSGRPTRKPERNPDPPSTPLAKPSKRAVPDLVPPSAAKANPARRMDTKPSRAILTLPPQQLSQEAKVAAAVFSGLGQGGGQTPTGQTQPGKVVAVENSSDGSVQATSPEIAAALVAAEAPPAETSSGGPVYERDADAQVATEEDFVDQRKLARSSGTASHTRWSRGFRSPVARRY